MIEHLTTHYFFDATLIPDRPTIAHVGGDAATAARLLRRFPGARVVVIEADAANFAKLDASPLPLGVEARYAALAERNEIVMLYRFTNPGANSLWPMHERGGPWRLSSQTGVQGMTLHTMLAEVRAEALDLLLCNCEGAEIFALRQLVIVPGLADRVAQACMATHWRHYAVYEKRELDAALEAVAGLYDVQSETIKDLEYVLLRRCP